MVTVEDLIEEIVGDVRDEHDDATPDVVAAGNGWQVSGLLRIDEVAAATGYHAPEGEYETIGGLVLEQLGRIPVGGDDGAAERIRVRRHTARLCPGRPGCCGWTAAASTCLS